MQKEIDEDGAGVGDAYKERYLYDIPGAGGFSNILQVYRQDGSDDPYLERRLLHGPAVDQILAEEQYDAPGSMTSHDDPLTEEGEVLWTLTDNLGSVRDIVTFDVETAVANHVEYTSFGVILSETNAAFATLQAFTGQERDSESDLYHYDERPYDPVTGQFIRADSILDDLFNTYRYVRNSPTNWIDSNGREPNQPNGFVPNNSCIRRSCAPTVRSGDEMQAFLKSTKKRPIQGPPTREQAAAPAAAQAAQKQALNGAVQQAADEIAAQYKQRKPVPLMPRIEVCRDGSVRQVTTDIAESILTSLMRNGRTYYAMSIEEHGKFIKIETTDEFYLGTDEEILSKVMHRAGAIIESQKSAAEKRSDFLDVLQTGLDTIGLIPVIGEVADVASGIVSAGRGDITGVLLSGASAIPLLGNVAGGVKIGRRFASAMNKFANLVDAVGGHTKLSKAIIDKVRGKVDNLDEVLGAGKTTKPRTRKVQSVEGAGPHTGFKRDPQTGKITGYTEYDANGNPVKRFRGEGRPHGDQNPPFILERKPGKGPGSEPKVPRPPRPDELPPGY